MTLAPALDPLPVGRPLGRSWIERHIPHHGAMCLLDEVAAWDLGEIRCRASSHGLGGNPLRSHGRLGAACGVEYAGQAMAVHGAIVAALTGTRARAGYLASIRNLLLQVTRLDDVPGPLMVNAQRLAGDDGSALYEFSLTGDGRVLLSGRAGIVFAAEPT